MNTLRILRAPAKSRAAEPITLDSPEQLQIRSATAADGPAFATLLQGEVSDNSTQALHHQFTGSIQPWSGIAVLWAVFTELARRWTARNDERPPMTLSLVNITLDSSQQALLALIPFTLIAATTTVLLLLMWRTFGAYEAWSNNERALWEHGLSEASQSHRVNSRISSKEGDDKAAPAQVWTSLLQGRYVGALLLLPITDLSTGDIYGAIHIVLHAHHRQDATGTGLIDTAMQWAKKAGWKRLYINVSQYQTALQRTLDEQQFQPVERPDVSITRHFLANTPGQVATKQKLLQHLL